MNEGVNKQEQIYVAAVAVVVVVLFFFVFFFFLKICFYQVGNLSITR